MSERADQPERPDEKKEVEDRLDSLFGEDELDPPSESGLKLDKTGALADREKIEPVKPYGRPDGPGPEEEAPVGPGTMPRKATIPPPIGKVRAPGLEDEAPPPPPDDEVEIAGGAFMFGESREEREVPAFAMDRYPVTNADYALFVKATGHRPPLYWPDGELPDDLRMHPAVGVDYYDALAYARWKGKDLPFEDEWERAARGRDGRVYPWGNESEPTQANTARLGLKTTMPLGWHEMNVSPDGVWDLVGNVWEITHSPAPGGGLVVRGGSWFDFALYAKSWFRFASRPDARNGTIGFRLVRRDQPREDEAEREVDPATVDARIQERRGPQPSIDPSQFSPEKRDLVPDYRRLRNLVQEREDEEAEARTASLIGRPGPTGERSPKPPSAWASSPAGPSRPRPTAPKPPPKPEPKPSPKPKARPAPKARPKAPSKPEVRPEPAPRAHVEDRRIAPPAPKPPAPAPVQVEADGDARRGGSLRGISIAALGLLVLLLGLLVSGVLTGGDDEPRLDGGRGRGPNVATVPVEPPSPARLAAPPDGDPRDAAPPTWIDGEARFEVRRFDEGVWLVVFADVQQVGAQSTVEAAWSIHRALRDTGAKLLLVLAREPFEGEDGLMELSAREEELRMLGAKGDATVWLDPAAGARGLLRSRWRVQDPQAALLLEDGHVRTRTAPSHGGFTRARLEALALRAIEHAK